MNTENEETGGLLESFANELGSKLEDAFLALKNTRITGRLTWKHVWALFSLGEIVLHYDKVGGLTAMKLDMEST